MKPDQLLQREVKQEYSKEDLEKWREGASNYKKFLGLDGVQDSLLSQNNGQLKALFLKEKPALFALASLVVLKPALLSFGFKVTGEYVYSAEQVQIVINNNQETFTQYGATDADAVMERLSREENPSANIIRGLVLGFPLKSAEAFEKTGKYKINTVVLKLYELMKTNTEKQKFLELNFYTEKREGNNAVFDFILQEIKSHQQELEITPEDIPELTSQLKELIQAKSVDVYDNAWFDYEDDPESQRRQLRLKAAFENSGILDLA